MGVAGAVATMPGRRGTALAYKPGERRVALGLFLLFAGFYLLTASGHFYADDEETVYAVTESLVVRHTFALPAGEWGLVAARGPDGRLYAQYPPGQAVAAIPLYLLGRALAPAFPAAQREYATQFAVALLNPLVTAATVMLLYLLARALGYRRRAALGLAAVYGLATGAWPHGRTFFAEPLTALCTLLAFYGIYRGTESGAAGARGPWRGLAPGWLALSGAALAAGFATKPHAAVAAPVLALYLAWRVARPRRAEGRWRLDWRRALAGALAWGGALAVALAPLLVFDALVYGGPLRTGYPGSPEQIAADVPWFSLTGTYGLLLSSGKGVFWYSPPLLLALGGGWLFYRRHRAEALACLGLFVLHVWFFSRYSYWHGDGSWGPRYLMLALPFALLPLVALLEALPGRRTLAGLVAAVVAAGVVVQLLGVLVNFDWYILRSDEQARHFSPPASPLVWHARLLAERAGEWRLRLFPPPDTALLVGGFWPAEPPPGANPRALFPRWTTGAGEIALHAGAREPLLVKLTFFDQRPPAQRRPPAVLVDGAPLPDAALQRRDFSGDGTGWVYEFTVPASALRGDAATVTLASTTWNPKRAGVSARDQDLGLFVDNVEVWRDGRPWRVAAALPLPTMGTSPRERFWWFNDDRAPDDTRHHLVDLWAWYAAVAGFGRGLTVAWLAGYAAAGLLVLAAGAAALRPLLPGRRARPRGQRRGFLSPRAANRRAPAHPRP